jgi:hypothetical protein
MRVLVPRSATRVVAAHLTARLIFPSWDLQGAAKTPLLPLRRAGCGRFLMRQPCLAEAWLARGAPGGPEATPQL